MSDVEKLLFPTSGQVSVSTAGLDAINESVSKAMAQHLGIGSRLAETFAWWLVRQLVTETPHRTDETSRAHLLAARHLLALGDYTDEATIREETGKSFDRIRGSEVRPRSENEQAEDALRASSTLRMSYAAAAAFGGSRALLRTPTREHPSRRLEVVHTLATALAKRIDGAGSLQSDWKDFYNAGAETGLIQSVRGLSGGWGPTRDTWNSAALAPYPVFNSRTDHPVLKDTRTFFRASEASGPILLQEPRSYLVVEPRKIYRGVVIVSYDSHPGRAENVPIQDIRVRVQGPGRMVGSGRFTAFVEVPGVTPQALWDSLIVVLPHPTLSAAIRLAGNASATTERRGRKNPVEASKRDLFGDGVQLGGLGEAFILRPADYAAVMFDFVIDMPDFEIDAVARRVDGNEFLPRVHVGPGDVFEVKIEYRNTGTVQQDGVQIVLGDLPLELRYVEGSLEIANSKTGGWRASGHDLSPNRGVSLGSYTAGANAFVKFRLMARDRRIFRYETGIHWLTTDKLIKVFTANGSKSTGITTLLSV
ncbi:hypothetical protein ACWZJV_05385 [Nocardioides sp. WG-D5]